METTKFKTGDLVKTKEGSHNMIVLGYQNVPSTDPTSRKVLCKWFKGNQSYSLPFSEDTLVKVDIEVNSP